MPAWMMNCPKCGTLNEVAASAVTVDCGRVSCTCTCTNCRNRFENEQPYWRWLGMNGPPPETDKEHHA